MRKSKYPADAIIGRNARELVRSAEEENACERVVDNGLSVRVMWAKKVNWCRVQVPLTLDSWKATKCVLTGNGMRSKVKELLSLKRLPNDVIWSVDWGATQCIKNYEFGTEIGGSCEFSTASFDSPPTSFPNHSSALLHLSRKQLNRVTIVAIYSYIGIPIRRKYLLARPQLTCDERWLRRHLATTHSWICCFLL